MSSKSAPPPPKPTAAAARLHKQKSLPAPDLVREEAWQRKKKTARRLRRCERCKSLTDDDLDELKASMELGFGFDGTAEFDRKLVDAFPALGLYQAVNRQYRQCLSRSSSVSSAVSDNGSERSSSSSMSLYDPGDDPEIVKTRLKQWAQVVACSVRNAVSLPIT